MINEIQVLENQNKFLVSELTGERVEHELAKIELQGVRKENDHLKKRNLSKIGLGVLGGLIFGLIL